MSSPAGVAAAVLTAHYPAVRAALEAARTAETGTGPNRYTAALDALDGAVFGLASQRAHCHRCGGKIYAVDMFADHWSHVPQPDPVADFLNEDHEAAPVERLRGGPR